MDERATLRIVGPALPDEGPLLGLWEVEPSAAAFAAGEAAMPRWEVALPSPEEAGALLEAQERRLQQQAEALALARRRLERLARGGAEAFAAETLDPLARADAELWSMVALLGGGEEAVAFAALPSWEALRQRWERFVRQVNALLAARLNVETRVRGRRVAATVLGWDGVLHTALLGAEAEDEAMLAAHRRSLELAMRSQREMLNLFAVIFGGAATLALKAALPVAAWTLLPAVWKYVQDVQEALAALREAGG